MKLLVLTAMLLQKGPPNLWPEIMAVDECRNHQKKLLENASLLVSQLDKPKDIKEFHCVPISNTRVGLFVLPNRRVIWLENPVIIRGNALRIDLKTSRSKAKLPPRDGVTFENDFVRVRNIPATAHTQNLVWSETAKTLTIYDDKDPQAPAVLVEIKG
ncbi:hypothetical protein [Bryobacter aggregatus]|uniref:hypothetical protein n=1 Tax=Bryobacter aggregatus TaxID=360054 RepID=UPI0004E16A9C|nr:hypothetical protein [Bryobacter aggregatus]